MEFKQTTIAPAGRNKYGNYMSSGNITKSVVSVTYAGNDTTTTIADNGQQEEEGTSNFYCMLSQTNATFNAIDLVQGTSASTLVIAYRGYEKAVTYVMDMNAVSAETEGETIISLTQPNNYGIKNMPETGLTVSVSGNGTSAATIIFTADNGLSGNSGTLYIPVCVYKRSDNIPEPDDLYSWYEHKEDCEIVWLEYAWNVNRNATTSYAMDLSNQMAGVNVSSTTEQGDILYPNSVAALTCTAATYLNGELVTGITYSISIQPRFNARGVDIVNSADTGVLLFTSAGTNSFNFLGPSLPIDVVATLNGDTIATKTMTVNKNYPGSDGTPAHTRYIVTDYDAVKFNPNTSAFTPNQVVGRVMLQVGDQEPDYDTATTIYQWYDDLETGKTSAIGSITASTYLGIGSITFALKNSNDIYYEIEEVPVMSEGVNGEPGEPGASGTPGESSWYLTLSNDNASINCDSNGNIYPGVVRPTCKAKLYHGAIMDTSTTFSVDYGGASGVTSGVSNGILTLTFRSGSTNPFKFNTTSVAITISASTDGEVRDVKIMNVTKSYAGDDGESPFIGANGNWWIGLTDTGIQAEGENGETPYIGSNGNWWIGNTDTGIKAEGQDAVSYWLEPSYTEAIYDPNTNTVDPSSITCSAYKQVGQGAVAPAADATIKYSWQRRSTGTFTNETAYTSAINITTGNCISYKRLRFKLYVGNTQVDMEDIDILANGLDGQDGGQGRTGAAIRGPYSWNEYSGSTRCWCAGETSGSCDECDKWIDVIYKDDTYYYCNTSYYGKLSPWNTVKNYWTSGQTFDFIATRLLLAQNASIDFLTNNELYLRDSNNNITGGAAGGTGIIFWAGAENPSDAPFKVDYQGIFSATTGQIGPYTIDNTGLNAENSISIPGVGTRTTDVDYGLSGFKFRSTTGNSYDEYTLYPYGSFNASHYTNGSRTNYTSVSPSSISTDGNIYRNEEAVVTSKQDGGSLSLSQIFHIVHCTQAEYNNMTKDNNTMYIIE